MKYVKNEDKFVYSITEKKAGGDNFNYYINLDLVAGWDYVNPDESDRQGYVGASFFTEDVQFEQYCLNILDETIEGRLEEEGYKFIELEDLRLQDIVSQL